MATSERQVLASHPQPPRHAMTYNACQRTGLLSHKPDRASLASPPLRTRVRCGAAGCGGDSARERRAPGSNAFACLRSLTRRGQSRLRVPEHLTLSSHRLYRLADGVSAPCGSRHRAPFVVFAVCVGISQREPGFWRSHRAANTALFPCTRRRSVIPKFSLSGLRDQGNIVAMQQMWGLIGDSPPSRIVHVNHNNAERENCVPSARTTGTWHRGSRPEAW